MFRKNEFVMAMAFTDLYNSSYNISGKNLSLTGTIAQQIIRISFSRRFSSYFVLPESLRYRFLLSIAGQVCAVITHMKVVQLPQTLHSERLCSRSVVESKCSLTDSKNFRSVIVSCGFRISRVEKPIHQPPSLSLAISGAARIDGSSER